jgi:hypothetical protein
MKKSPQQKKLEDLLGSSKFSACGFMGNDKRSLWEIIDADAAELERLARTTEEVAARMEELTDFAKPALGDWVEVGKNLKVSIDDNRGMIPCPWPHHVRCLKRITTAMQVDTGKRISWSELNTHLIKEHGFFEGRGSPFRIEPRQLVEIIFAE